ncbi:MAG: hypothetical protein ACD_14C00040G0002 [uncultured bacterium]|nr:MAG: hypothetical protein ACD_14C00040G0002 [uncultured bacterium]KKQ43833.1 MAG: hypothetical protein US63_C0042G0011 [Candidatus Moranbacteria bacterium GW2011_GWC2_37_8]KKQ60738.1 MAG: hypothetical protein US82_C0029G0003 [Parcubacteria group bacterium GW2011_GWC1_38_22]KKQ81438.1 MAG: hypothetical protein UT03_C0002G0012 [Candidatus Moranbacteria bacterium GW2011_GWD2_38_7]
MNKKIVILVMVLSACLGLGFFLAQNFSEISNTENDFPQEDTIFAEKESAQNIESLNQNLQSDIQLKSETVEVLPIKENIKLDVPFIVQAPLGNWSDPVFQNACEESSIVMAMGWVNGAKTISSQAAMEQINNIVKFENETFGYNADTDMSDVEKIFKQYFNHQNVTVKEDVMIEDIVNELQYGNLLIAPVFGQALGNPFFTSPGPIAHMLVVIGYDGESKEFITNDPGTKRGADYRYDEKVLFEAIWEYPSGKGPIETPVKGGIEKTVLIIKPK